MTCSSVIQQYLWTRLDDGYVLAKRQCDDLIDAQNLHATICKKHQAELLDTTWHASESASTLAVNKPFNSCDIYTPDNRLMAIFHENLGKSPFRILLELRTMELVVTTGALRCAKLQSNRQHNKPTSNFFTGRMPFLSPNQQSQNTEGKKYHIPWTCSLPAHLGSSNLVFDH